MDYSIPVIEVSIYSMFSQMTPPSSHHLCSSITHVKKGLYSFFLATFLAPLIMFFHECGHYLVDLAFDVNPELHVGGVSFHSHHPITKQEHFWMSAGGPLVHVLLATTGFLWLRRQRPLRIGAAPTRTDCLGIVLVTQNAAFFAGLFVVDLIRQTFLKHPNDTGKMSLAMGLPVWLLPTLFASLSLVLLGATMRLFPHGYRFVPFGFAAMGLFAGLVIQLFLLLLWELRFN